MVRSVADVKSTQPSYVDKHTHNCDAYHIVIGTGAEFTGLKTEFVIGEEKAVVESPVGVHIPTGTPHSQRIVEGSGHFFNFVPRGHYSDSLFESVEGGAVRLAPAEA